MKKTFILCSVSLLATALLFTGCGKPTAQAPATQQGNSTTAPTAPVNGVTLSPKSFNGSDFTDFLQEAAGIGKVIGWYGDWNELDNEQGASYTVANLANQYKYTPLVIVSTFSSATGDLTRPLDDATKARYRGDAVTYVQKYHPAYFGIGIEVNALYDKSPDNFAEFVDLFNSAAQQIHVSSPQTIVFPVFQLEKTKGLHGGLFGGKNDESKAQWNLLSQFTEANAVGFTTYPGIIYGSPSDIPRDYYTDIQQHTTLPILFTEIGWPSNGPTVSGTSTAAQQKDFVSVFKDRTANMTPLVRMWSFLYDQNAPEPFKSMGLKDASGNKKPAYDLWASY